jgi:hypothetical protein
VCIETLLSCKRTTGHSLLFSLHHVIDVHRRLLSSRVIHHQWSASSLLWHRFDSRKISHLLVHSRFTISLGITHRLFIFIIQLSRNSYRAGDVKNRTNSPEFHVDPVNLLPVPSFFEHNRHGFTVFHNAYMLRGRIIIAGPAPPKNNPATNRSPYPELWCGHRPGSSVTRHSDSGTIDCVPKIRIIKSMKQDRSPIKRKTNERPCSTTRINPGNIPSNIPATNRETPSVRQREVVSGSLSFKLTPPM